MSWHENPSTMSRHSTVNIKLTGVQFFRRPVERIMRQVYYMLCRAHSSFDFMVFEGGSFSNRLVWLECAFILRFASFTYSGSMSYPM